jgi:hypothetical protein
MQEPQSLGQRLAGEKIDAGGVAAGPGKAGDKTVLDRVLTDGEDDRDRRGCGFGRERSGYAPGVAITATCRRTRSVSIAGRRSNWPSSQWYSTVTFWPSMVPVSLRPLRNAGTLRATASSADPMSRNPIHARAHRAAM